MGVKRKGKCHAEAVSEGKKIKVVKKHDQVRVVHRCETKYLVEVNNILKERHRKRIEATPFRWCLELQKTLDINCPLLREVLLRWVPQGEFIRVGQQLVRLSVYDVCICLGLSMVGEVVEFDSELNGLVGSMFEKKPITIVDIINKIRRSVGSDVDDVDGVCRLYLLLCFAVFYFPRTSRTVTNMPFKLLDNLEMLSQYNWAESVHSFLIGGLSRGYKVLRERKNTRSLNVAGCFAVVQIWAGRRLGLDDSEGGKQFPRILSWPSLKIWTVNIESIFGKNQVVLDWSLSELEKENPIVDTAIRIMEEQSAKVDGDECRVHSKVQSDMQAKFEKHQRLILELKAEIKKLRADYIGCGDSEPCGTEGNNFNEGTDVGACIGIIQYMLNIVNVR